MSGILNVLAFLVEKELPKAVQYSVWVLLARYRR